MTAVCYTPWKIPTIRATLLNSCGVPVTGCSTVVSDGIISVAMTKEYEDREDFFKKNGDGTFCVKATTPPILKWIGLELTFCNVDPDLVNLLSAEPRVYDDASTPRATGFSTQEGSAASVNFALETWTRIADQPACTGGIEYGYTIFPWVIEGRVGDVTYENGTADFVITSARTRSGSPWGLGPYMVDYSDNPAGSTTQIPLLTAIGSTQHMRQFLTRLAPPTASCGCQTLTDLIP